MIAAGINIFIEIGPGRVLNGLVKKIDKTKMCLNLEDMDSLKKIVERQEELQTRV